MDATLNQSIAFLVGILSSVVASWLWLLLVRRSEAKFSFRQVLGYVLDLVNQIENDEFRPQLIVCVDRNSTILGGIVAGHLGLRTVLAVATENLRLPDGSRSVGVIDGFLPSSSFLAGKELLLFICFNDSGTSLEAVYRHLANIQPQPKIRTAAVFTSASPRILPTYFVKKLGVNLRTPIHELMPKMPWVTSSWKHVFAKERLPRERTASLG